MNSKMKDMAKDILAGIAGYVVSVLLVGSILTGVGVLVAKTGDETLFARYEFLIACATFLGFFAGGIVLGAIRPSSAIRNAAILLLVMVIVGAWRMGGEMVSVIDEGNSIIDIVLIVWQLSGFMFGAWLMRRRYLQKKRV